MEGKQKGGSVWAEMLKSLSKCALKRKEGKGHVSQRKNLSKGLEWKRTWPSGWEKSN